MANEIDQYLKDKFCDGVGKMESSTRLFLLEKYLYDHFQQIKKILLEDIFSRSPVPEYVRIREKLYCLNDLWTEFRTVSKSDLITRKKIWQKLTSIKDELKPLMRVSGSGTGEASNATAASKQPDGEASSSKEKPAVPRQSALSFDASKVHGFGDDVTSLEKVLVRQGSGDRFKAIGIIGKAGIGKSALCQLLFNTKEVNDYFLPRIWASMPRQPGDNPEQKVEILKRMLVNLGVEDHEKIIDKYKIDEEHKLTGLLYALHLQLQGKRYLIVLDDARETDKWYGQLNSLSARDGKWDALARGLPKGCGGAVIVTSRSEESAKMMVGRGREEILHSVLPLSNPDSSWSIFNEAAGPDRKHLDSDSSINQGILKEQILQKCAGLPLTAKMMGEYQNLPD